MAVGTTTSPVSSSVSRTAPWMAVSSDSRKPPGCAQVPYAGSMARRSSTRSPSSVTGRVVTTIRGLTYAMKPHAAHHSRSRCSPGTLASVSGAPQREQKPRLGRSQDGTPSTKPSSVLVGAVVVQLVEVAASASGRQHDEHDRRDDHERARRGPPPRPSGTGPCRGAPAARPGPSARCARWRPR